MPNQPTITRNPPHIWAVVLGYNGIEHTLATLDSLEKVDYPALTVLFVDNGSRDGSMEKVQLEHPGTRLLHIPDNIGFAGGCNAGMGHALQEGADYVLLLNNDIEVAPDMVHLLLEPFNRDPRCGMTIPKIFYHAARNVIWSAGAALTGLPPRLDMLHTTCEDDGRFDHLETLEFATLCAALIKREALETTGLLDPNFFLLWEDYEYCARIRKSGYRISFVPQAHMWHKVSMTIQDKKPSAFTMFNRGRSKALFCRRHPEYRRVCWPGYPIAAALSMLLKGHPDVIAPFWRGLREGHRMPYAPVPSWNSPLPGNARPLHTP